METPTKLLDRLDSEVERSEQALSAKVVGKRVGKVLKSLRYLTEPRVMITDVAAATGLDVGTIGKYEQGLRLPSPYALESLLSALSVEECVAARIRQYVDSLRAPQSRVYSDIQNAIPLLFVDRGLQISNVERVELARKTAHAREYVIHFKTGKPRRRRLIIRLLGQVAR